MTDRRSLTRAVRTLVLVAAAGIACYVVASQWSDVQQALSDLGPVSIVFAVVTGIAGPVAGALCWRALLADTGRPLPPRTTAYVFFVGQLAKYLPGGIWSIVAQMELGHDSGAERRRTGSAGVVAMGITVTTGLGVALACLPFASAEALGAAAWLLVLLPVGIVLLHPRLLTRVVNRALLLLRLGELDRPLSGRGVRHAVGWALVGWACYGAHIYALSKPLAESGHRLPLLALGGYALAWTVGFLAVVAPAGAGAREALLIVALSPALTTAEATAVALVSRVILTLSDLGWAGVGASVRPPAAAERGPYEPPRSAGLL